MAGQQIIQAQPAGLQAATLRAAAPAAAATAAQQIITLPNGQQAIVAGAAAAGVASPQIMQIPQTVQQMALVPVSGPNGQTVYQQMPVPVQVQPAQTTALVPVAVQTSSGQQG